MLADQFVTPEGSIVRRAQGGTGHGWWMVTFFRDGSVRATTLGKLRVSPSAKAALDYWQGSPMAPGEDGAKAGIIEALQSDPRSLNGSMATDEVEQQQAVVSDMAALQEMADEEDWG